MLRLVSLQLEAAHRDVVTVSPVFLVQLATPLPFPQGEPTAGRLQEAVLSFLEEIILLLYDALIRLHSFPLFVLDLRQDIILFIFPVHGL